MRGFLAMTLNYMCSIGLTFATVFYIDHINVYIESHKTCIFELIRLKATTDKYDGDLISIVMDIKELRLTGWRCFELNRGFLLNFIQSLVTLSVLFIQLLNSGLS